MEESYHAAGLVDPGADDEIGSALEELVREGARLMLERALEAEIDEFLGRERYARGAEFRGYRNGYQRPREIAVGSWSVPVRAPRVADVPEGLPEFESEIVPKKRRLTQETQMLFAELYLEGLSSGDFEPVFRHLLGATAPLSPNTILRLKDRWAEEYGSWRRRRLDHTQFVYVWADGIYLGAGLEKQNSCLLTLLGANSDGTKELLAMEIGYRESKDSWAEVLRALRERGLSQPLVFIGDGNLGLWAALTDVFPEARRQRCWNHRLMNVQDKLPRRLQRIVRSRLYQTYTAPTRQECEASRDELVDWLRGAAQMAAAETVVRDWEDFVTFYDFPREHWFHLRTTNPVESVFASVRLRTNVTKRARNRENALYLVFKIVQRLQRNWRALNGGPHLMQAVSAGVRFTDGQLQPPNPAVGREVEAA
jgi:putative transposase